MALNNLGLGFVFTARDLASAKMQRLERRFSSLDARVTGGTDRMTSAFRQLGVGLAIFTAGAAAVGGALALANAAGRFEQGLAAVGAVTRATSRELGMLREAAINAGIETQFSPDEAIQGLTSLATAGQTAAQATRTLIPVLDLAAGSLGQLGVASAAEAVVGTLNAYGMTADQAAGVTDRLLRITQLTNFQTRDFEAGLAKAAATGAVFNQGLNDVLITMGLLRNRNIDASSAATAFREATRRVGSDSRAQQAILGTGVQVFDRTSGQMRSMVDIMSEFATATRDMSDAERNRRVVQAFGARGLLAFNAVMNASFTTMRDGREVTLRGAEAIEALRNEMQGAEGTAGRFREQLLDTFEGQKTLLKGTLQTFAVVLGEPFAAVFKPIVRLLVNVLNAILRAFQAIPAPIKKIFAGLVVAVGGFLMLVGGVIAAKGAIALLAIGFKALGITIGGVMATLLPAILIVAVLGAVVAGFVVAFRRNVGGIADFARRMWDRITLFFNGLNGFDQVQDLTMLLVPGRATSAVHNAMVAYCEVDRDGTVFAILDPPANQSATGIVDYVQSTAALIELTEFAAIYWPRVLVLNPAKSVFGPADKIAVPPSGIIAGVYSRTDSGRPGGVYDPPAGIDKGRMFGVLGFETDEVLEEAKRDLVYPKRINPLTTGPGLPRYIDGSRTLKGGGNFPYVAERRGVIFIERSLKQGLQFARHKNNTEGLRAQVRRTITAFLLTQMNNGAFRSREPSKAFFVDVSEALNTPSVIFAGKLIARVGLATNKPAEFIVLRISQDTRALEAELAAAGA